MNAVRNIVVAIPAVGLGICTLTIVGIKIKYADGYELSLPSSIR